MRNFQDKKSVVYGVIGAVALFLIGGMTGYVINGSGRVNHSVMSQDDCNLIAKKIINAANNQQPDLIEQLNKVYSENCLNRVFEQPKPVKQPEPKKLSENTCEAIEELLLQELYDEKSMDPLDHERNANVYYKIQTKGCEENQEKYFKLRARELDIAKALQEENVEQDSAKNIQFVPTCLRIEESLFEQLTCLTGYCSSDRHINDAKIYANLSERGCPENTEKYKKLAKQELEIARALNDDEMERSYQQDEAVEIVETYKRLKMQAEAAQIIEKAKKLTDPAIDFIIKLEKIIEE